MDGGQRQSVRTHTRHKSGLNCHSHTPPSSAMKRDALTVASWEFDRIIMCHGVRRITGIVNASSPSHPHLQRMSSRRAESKRGVQHTLGTWIDCHAFCMSTTTTATVITVCLLRSIFSDLYTLHVTATKVSGHGSQVSLSPKFAWLSYLPR